MWLLTAALALPLSTSLRSHATDGRGSGALGDVSAVAHVAPMTTAVAADIFEEPATVLAGRIEWIWSC
jgi:hypothetical protein